MTSALIVGQPNVGKTSFLINFAQYLGVEKLKLLVRQPAGFLATKTYSLENAEVILTSDTAHKTKNLQSVRIKLPVGKQDKELKLIDSCGLESGIHSEFNIRKAMTQTIERMLNSELLLHVIDLTTIKKRLDHIDQELYDLLKNERDYIILANKIDKDETNNNLSILQNIVKKNLVIPVSAIYQQGFDKVKLFLMKRV